MTSILRSASRRVGGGRRLKDSNAPVYIELKLSSIKEDWKVRKPVFQAVLNANKFLIRSHLIWSNFIWSWAFFVNILIIPQEYARASSLINKSSSTENNQMRLIFSLKYKHKHFQRDRKRHLMDLSWFWSRTQNTVIQLFLVINRLSCRTQYSCSL